MFTDTLRSIRQQMTRCHDWLAEYFTRLMRQFYSNFALRGKIGLFHLDVPGLDADGIVMVREVGDQKITTTIPFRIENRWLANEPRLTAQAVAEIFTALHLSSYRAVGFHFKGMWYVPNGKPMQVHPTALYYQPQQLAFE